MTAIELEEEAKKTCAVCGFHGHTSTHRAYSPQCFVDQAHDPVNHPKHYTSHPSGIECIQVTRHMSFNIGNVVKYCWRADDKGAPIEDLKKAAWYLNDEIQRREKSNGP